MHKYIYSLKEIKLNILDKYDPCAELKEIVNKFRKENNIETDCIVHSNLNPCKNVLSLKEGAVTSELAILPTAIHSILESHLDINNEEKKEVYDRLRSVYQRLGPFKYPQIIYDPELIEEIQYTFNDIKVVAIFAKTYPNSNLLFGIKVTQKGKIVEGRFDENRLNAKGYSRLMNSNGEWSVGNILNAKLNGYCSKYFNNEILNGIFNENKLDGKGEHFTKNYYKSSGKFIQNKREGIHEFTKQGTECTIIREYRNGKILKIPDLQISMQETKS